LFDELGTHGLSDKRKESLVTAIYVGSVLILIEIVYFVNLPSSLLDGVVKFFSTLTLAEVPGTGISLPAPLNPAAHMALYTAAFQFALGIGILEIGVLAIRVFWRSPMPRKAETVENIVFWLGASYLVTTYLMNMAIASEWFVFWAGVILIFGLALVARAFVLIAKR
jgi:hypothetical protein